MRIPRIFTPQALTEGQQIDLDDAAANHVGRVLRMEKGRPLFVFNGESECHYSAIIDHSDKKRVSITLKEKHDSQLESPISIHVAQAISKGDKMEWVIQKCVELGATEITPIWSEHCDVKLNHERFEKKLQQWKGIIISACEQCGRDRVPRLNPVVRISDWVSSIESDVKWVLDPRGNPAKQQADIRPTSAAIAIGPEGGLSADEIELCKQHGFGAKLIGPRVLRTETAALTAITLLQAQWGDF